MTEVGSHATREEERGAEARGTLCLFAKPPRAGQAKTRLRCDGIDGVRAAQLARAFLLDAWNAFSSVSWAEVVLASTDTMDEVRELASAPLWLQGGGDLGARIERIMRRALSSAPFAVALGADSPGMPLERLTQARELLRDHDAVLGPSDDGGFYLLAMTRCPSGLLEGLPWSVEQTFARTHERLLERGLRVATLAPWFDVDRPEDLLRLRASLERTARAPRTAAVLRELAPTLDAMEAAR